MAAEPDRDPSPPRFALRDAAPLPRHVADYDFFQLVRVLESRLGTTLGGTGPAAEEAIRLRPNTSLAFPRSDVEELRQLQSGRVQVTVNFLGLYGATSPLPRSYAEQIRWDEREYPQMRDFLDILHHRLLSLLYRGWRRHRYEQAFAAGGRDMLSRILLSLAGVDPDDAAAQLGVPPVRVLSYLGLLLLRTRPLSGLLTLLRQELPWPLRVEQCASRWVVVAEHDRFRLTAREPMQLGRDIVVGARRVDRLGQLAVEIGPVDFGQFLQLLPGGPGQARLLALVRFYVRQPLDLCLRVLVPAAELRGDRRLRLGGGEPRRLGQGAVCGTPQRDRVDFDFFIPMMQPAAAGSC